MISIITAIHNGITINKLFLHYLKKYTYHPFELIIIDNNSTDGSKEFFEQNGVKVIRNDGNYSYPYCQNQGIKAAQYDIFAFLNNDIIVSPQWDKKMIETMQIHQIEILCPCGIERLELPQKTKQINRKWNLIKNTLSLFGRNETTFKLMHRWMYGNWEQFCEKRFQKFDHQIVEGFIGNTVMMNKSVVDKLGMWDERVQAADFDLYIRAKKRNLEIGDMKPMQIALGVFNHHYIRITVKSKPMPFSNKHLLIKLEEKWSKEDLEIYLKDNV